MELISLMADSGFRIWRTRHNVVGFQRSCSVGRACRVVIIPVNGKGVKSLQDKVLACYFDEKGAMLHDMFFDSLAEFLDSQGIEIPESSSATALENGRPGLPGQILDILCGASAFLRRRVLFSSE